MHGLNMKYEILKYIYKCKGQIHPRTGHEGPEWEQMYNLSFFNLSVIWGWVVKATPPPLYLQETDPLSIVQEAEWAPRLAWRVAGKFPPTGIRSPDRPTRSGSLCQLHSPAPLK
jgi:hypothetical protein